MSVRTRTALITGATAGIGEAAARKFVGAGWRVIAAGRRADRLEALADSLGRDSVHPLSLDIRDANQIAKGVASLPAQFRDIDLLINNAGLALPDAPSPAAELDQWKTMIDTNITGLVSLTHALLPGLIARRGAIINISSAAANYPYAAGHVYGGTKAFVRQFSLCLRSDLHGKGVRVTSIEPGLVETEFMLVRYLQDENAADAVYRHASALKPEDLADTLHWVAEQPPHVNINSLEIMPTSQSFAGFRIARGEDA
ncbi:NADP-dependent 3-hydroxy acid dehydrogenase [Tardibacter chloracetimidivorans]|uniref:NADP-dependent 3-hydroxy acid dehydrogenase n=1 Tax=Tardibacter chloracetimidivorans TaxID=1921510 RepID=A0A1L3ZXI0_9SPHN|nr:SDR family NAD(P)-dependent oxidoreductase [Tardibacter chloracetimidivorans]API60315.1 NADP-dependent 3-hydroxy acid dehydrogenase [Tardibacter chloracetimidivorans]